MKNKRVALLGILTTLVILAGCGSDTMEEIHPSSVEESVVENASDSPDEDLVNVSDGDDSESESGSVAGNSGSTVFETMDTSGAWDTDTKDESMTLMVYMVGSDLESGGAAATKDLEEMAANNADWDQVNLVIYTGGSPLWHNDVPDDVNALLHMTAQGFEQVDAFEQKSMGEADNLTRFLNYAVEQYPADNYGLILWDHGNGPLIGYGMDKLYDNDSLTLTEIGDALEASPFSKERKLEFIGFDACLMASVELVCIVDDYADYLIASQEVEPSFGWNYDFLDRLGKIETDVLAGKIVNSYIVDCAEAFSSNPFFNKDATLAAIDLSKGEDLQRAINDLFSKAANDVSGDYMELAVDRVESRSLGRATTGSEYDLVDMNDLVSIMAKKYPAYCADIQTLIEQMVVANESNTEKVCGLSIYYPYYNKNYYQNSWKSVYEEMGLFPDYLTYLSRYEDIWLGTDMKEYFEGALVPKEGETGTYTLALTEEQQLRYAASGYYIMRRTGTQMYQPVFFSRNTSMENGTVIANFDGNIIYVEADGDEFITILRERDTVGDETYYSTVVALNAKDETAEELGVDHLSANLILTLNNVTGEVTVKSFTELEDENQLAGGKEKEIVPEDWSWCTMYNIRDAYLERDENGNVKPFFEWTEGDWITGREFYLNDGFKLNYRPMYDDGYEYYIMFLISDLQDNEYCSELLPISMADAPVKEEPEPTVIEGKEADSEGVRFYDADGICGYLRRVQDVDSGQLFYQVSIENQNDFPVNVYFDDCLVNELYACGDFYFPDIPSQSMYTSRLSEVNSILGYLREDHLQSFQFELKVVNTRDYVTHVQPSVLKVNMNESWTVHQGWLPYRSAYIEERQTLKTWESLQMDVLHLGYGMGIHSKRIDSDSEPLQLQLMVENNNSDTEYLAVRGVRINGMYLDAGSSVSLGSNQKSVIDIGVSKEGLESLTMIWGEDWKIRTMELLVEREEEKTWISLLSDSTESESELLDFRPTSDQLIYEDSEHSVYLIDRQVNKGRSSNSYRWYLYVENRGTTDYQYWIDPRMRSGEEDAYNLDWSLSGRLAAGEKAVFWLYYSGDEPEEWATRLCWSENRYDDTLPVGMTDVLELKVIEETMDD